MAAESALRLELANGSRIVLLPGNEKNVCCFSGVALLVIDEAGRLPDALNYAVRPILCRHCGEDLPDDCPEGVTSCRGYCDWKARRAGEHSTCG